MQTVNDGSTMNSQEWFAGNAGTPATTRVFDLRDFFLLLLRWKTTIFLVIVASVALATLAGILQPKTYKASAQVLIDPRGYKITKADVGVAPTLDGVTAIADVESQLQIMTSGSVLRRVVVRENLANDPEFAARPGLLGRIINLVRGQRQTVGDRILAAMARLETMISVRRSERSFVAQITVADTNSKRAARLAQAAAEAYLGVQNKNRLDLTKRLGAAIAERLLDLRERVEAAERRLIAYKAANNLVEINGKLESDEDLAELNKQLNQARARTVQAKARLDQVRSTPRSLLPGTGNGGDYIDTPTLSQLRVRLSEAVRQAAQLQRSFGPRHPQIKAAEARVASARAAINAELSRQRAAITSAYRQAQANQRSLEARIKRLKETSQTANKALVGARELQRAIAANRKVYEEFLVRARELTGQQGIIPNASRIITDATEPAAPSNLPLPVFILLGLIAGLPLGIGTAFVGDQLGAMNGHANRIDNPAHAASAAHHPSRSSGSGYKLLGTVPRMAMQRFIGRNRLRRAIVPPDDLQEMGEAALTAAADEMPSVTLVTGCTADGSSAEVALSIAACWAWQGYDVIAVDGDPAHANLSEYADVLGNPGLFDRFHRNVLGAMLWNRAGVPHLLASLDPQTRRMPEGARRFVAQRLEEVADEAEHLVIDAGAITANAFANVLAAAATRVILVAQDAQIGTAAFENTLAAIADAGAQVSGIVTVEPPPNRAEKDNAESSAVNNPAGRGRGARGLGALFGGRRNKQAA